MLQELVSGWEMAMTLEEAMVKVWRRALVERAAEVELDGQTFAVRETPRKHLREVAEISHSFKMTKRRSEGRANECFY